MTGAAGMTRLSIHQPQYFPWPGYIQKLMFSDVFVYLDSVSFSKNGFQNRNQVKVANGAAWLTVPVRAASGVSIRETALAADDWAVKHWKTIASAYARAPGFTRWSSEIEALLLGRSYDALGDLCVATTEWLLDKLQVGCRRLRSSDLRRYRETKADLVGAICADFGAKVYLSGSGAQAYLSKDVFDRVGCEVWFQSARALEYPQQFPRTGFVPGLSTLDLVLNCPDTAADLMRSHCDWTGQWP